MTFWLLWILAAPLPPSAVEAPVPAPAGDSSPRRLPACIDVRTEARFRNYGYDHLVTVRNGCDQAQACDVSTNVSPDASRVTVQAHSEAEVLTFRGSPAREFTAKVDCHSVS
jgi:hypothetical protein